MSKEYISSLSAPMRKQLQKEISAVLSIIGKFDFSAFSNIGGDKQFTANGVNVTTSTDGMVILNKQFQIELIRDLENYHGYTFDRSFRSAYEPVYFNIQMNITLKNDKFRMFSLEHNNNGSKTGLVNVLVGDEKMFIGNEWFDIIGFEEKIFQQSTVDKEATFDIHFFYDMLTKLHIFKRG